MKKSTLVIAGVLAIGGLAGCATPDQRASSDYGYGNSSTSSSNYVTYGVVESIQTTNTGVGGSSIGAGTIIGGVVGGLLGSQIGGGDGKTVATVAGVAGGALIGNQVDKNRQSTNSRYNVRVLLNNGDYQTINVENYGDLRVGDRVRIENNMIARY